MVGAPGVHDLVRVDPSIAARWCDAPPWVAASLERAPWLVVRRERLSVAHVDAIAAGVRGATRSQRFAVTVAADAVRERVTPWQLAVAAAADGATRLHRAFARVAHEASAVRIAIAPTGSFAFELASGVHVTHPASDLDVLAIATDVPRERVRALASAIARVTAETGVRIDAELAYPAGGVALGEALDGKSRVLFKTAAGPQLLPCPV